MPLTLLALGVLSLLVAAAQIGKAVRAMRAGEHGWAAPRLIGVVGLSALGVLAILTAVFLA